MWGGQKGPIFTEHASSCYNLGYTLRVWLHCVPKACPEVKNLRSGGIKPMSVRFKTEPEGLNRTASCCGGREEAETQPRKQSPKVRPLLRVGRAGRGGPQFLCMGASALPSFWLYVHLHPALSDWSPKGRWE
jgi:hypothetical protein